MTARLNTKTIFEYQTGNVSTFFQTRPPLFMLVLDREGISQDEMSTRWDNVKPENYD